MAEAYEAYIEAETELRNRLDGEELKLLNKMLKANEVYHSAFMKYGLHIISFCGMFIIE